MAAKKKSAKKKTTKSKKSAPRKRPVKKTAKKKLSVRKRAQKRPIAKKSGKKKRAAARPTTRRKQFLEEKRRASNESPDFQGASRAEQADSESVDELLEEGNTFEAGVVKGVEEADDADEKEVHTREMPEDDVPEEYLDEDR